jgi:hypothetical protein
VIQKLHVIFDKREIGEEALEKVDESVESD